MGEKLPPLRNIVEKKTKNISINNPTQHLFQREMARLTKLARSSEFHCTFCFKTFHSAQAMGGHHNGHKAERMEEKKLLVKDAIGHRKRSFLRTMKSIDDVESSNTANQMFGSIIDQAKTPVIPSVSCGFVENNDGKRLRMFLPIKEPSRAENFGVVHAEGVKGQPPMAFDLGGRVQNTKELDLTLRL